MTFTRTVELPVSPDEAFALMDAAWAAGINVFDTAQAYGLAKAIGVAIPQSIRAVADKAIQ